VMSNREIQECTYGSGEVGSCHDEAVLAMLELVELSQQRVNDLDRNENIDSVPRAA
jgi:hypothetical protein